MIEQKNLVLRVSRSLLELNPLIPPTTSKMAGLMNISGRTFQRKLTELGLSYRELVNKIRHEKAIALIESSDTPLSTVAYELGFGDLSSFSRAFKSWTGMSPRQYRNTQASGV
ncbi:AraC family transcriptional regulator [Endozoicomonas sp. SESOKO3]|nr:AraC family transcriptional regulator [Endozoicomonas sp. SESOKO3]